MVHPVKLGKAERVSYSKLEDSIEIPYLVEVQKKSYQWFLQEGLSQVLKDISPIMTNLSNSLQLSFIDYEFDIDEPTYPITECRIRDANFELNLVFFHQQTFQN